MNTFEEVKKQFAVWQHGDSEELVMVQSGYFASDQWLRTGDYEGIAGGKFGILGNDGRPGWVSKSNIRALASLEEFESLKQKSSIVFHRVLELKELGEDVVEALSVDHYRHFGKASCISEFVCFSSEGELESSHIIYNDNQSGLEKVLVRDRQTAYTDYDAVEKAIKEAILEFQSKDFLDDLEKHLNKLKTSGYCFIFSVG